MSQLSPRLIAKLLPARVKTIHIAYSGGVDSHVLLHLACQLPELRNKLSAVYIDHNLQADSAAWGEHCRLQCQQLGVAFQSIQVDARARPGDSPEAAARQARYQALSARMQAGDVLLLGQHREDQMETLLLQLFRGAGVQGLAAMPIVAAYGSGQMLRPLLPIAKQEILDYARHNDLQWIDDPSNQDSDFDRNFLRNQIIPQLKDRWPALDKTIARSAQHCADAHNLLKACSETWMAAVVAPDEKSLDISALLAFSSPHQQLILRQWLTMHDLQPPSEVTLQHIIEQVIHARPDASPVLRLQKHGIHRYRQRLYCVADLDLLAEETSLVWQDWHTDLILRNGYRLHCQATTSGISKRLWHNSEIIVTSRQGGETIALPGRAGSHCLKKLYQEAGIPPWQRQTRPLIYLDDRLAAVGELWIADWAWTAADGYRLHWLPQPKTR